MGCGCGGNKTRKYVVTNANGQVKTVTSLSAAITAVRKEGGHYSVVKS